MCASWSEGEVGQEDVNQRYAQYKRLPARQKEMQGEPRHREHQDHSRKFPRIKNRIQQVAREWFIECHPARVGRPECPASLGEDVPPARRGAVAAPVRAPLGGPRKCAQELRRALTDLSGDFQDDLEILSYMLGTAANLDDAHPLLARRLAAIGGSGMLLWSLDKLPGTALLGSTANSLIEYFGRAYDANPSKKAVETTFVLFRE